MSIGLILLAIVSVLVLFGVAQRVLDLHMLGATLPDLLQTLKTVSLEDCENRLREHFTEAHMALSIVIPENKEEKQ